MTEVKERNAVHLTSFLQYFVSKEREIGLKGGIIITGKTSNVSNVSKGNNQMQALVAKCMNRQVKACKY